MDSTEKDNLMDTSEPPAELPEDAHDSSAESKTQPAGEEPIPSEEPETEALPVVSPDEPTPEVSSNEPEHVKAPAQPLTAFQVTEIAREDVPFKTTSVEQYLKGCKWAPDGTCILTNNSDNTLRIYNLPGFLYQESSSLPSEPDTIPQAVVIKEGGLIHDFCWYPQMSSMDAATCCLLSCSARCPVHLWDAFDGRLRASYSPIDRVDEVEGASSLAFAPDGQRFYCGSTHFVRLFDLGRPGRECEKRELKHHLQPSEYRQPGIVSAIAVSEANPKVYAVGSYRKSVGLYAEPDGELISLLHGHRGGITQLAFSADGTKLFSGARQDSEIICWDTRSPGRILAIMQRSVSTNQRVQFDVSRENLLFSANTSGLVTVYDLNEARGENCPVGVKKSWRASSDCVNGVSLHPSMPMVATTSGQRHFDLAGSDDEDDEPEDKECCLKMWWLTKETSDCDNNAQVDS
ncbi:Hypothetical predicted protein [Cloeon dipterum]|uniref:WD repeat-containing protein 79 n=1 Tax=Cloeon dipterum TaxID=197152 RepID=A0A8S1DVN4_9INSE|nr:Hypothetical predicted protein [Cloeon dipterum]